MDSKKNEFKKSNKGKKRSGGRKVNVSLILLFLGLAVMLYPFASGFLKNLNDTKLVREFRENKLSEDWQNFKESMNKYNEDIKDGAFNSNAGNLSFDLDEDDNRDENENKSLIDQESIVDASGDYRVIGTLIIPKIDEEIPMYYGSNSRVLQRGVGILENTSYPGEETGHSVITGHRGTHNAKIFRHLDEIEEGDHFYIETPEGFLKYITYEYTIVEPDLVQLLGLEEGRDLVTLVTCHPFLINTERILVKAERGEMLPSDYEYLGISNEDDTVNPNKSLLMKILDDKLLLALLVLNLLMIILFIYILRRTLKAKNEEKKKIKTIQRERKEDKSVEKNVGKGVDKDTDKDKIKKEKDLKKDNKKN